MPLFSAGRLDRVEIDRVEIEPTPPTPGLAGLLVAGTVNENTAHCLGRGSKEMAAALEPRRGSRVNQAHISFVNQRRRLKRLPRLLLGQSHGSEVAQFVVDQRQELVGGRRITLLNGTQNARYFAHHC